MFRHKYSLSIVLALVISFQVPAQTVIDGFEFFGDDDSVIECKLTSDFKYLRKNKMNTSYQPATLTIYKSDGDSISIDLKIQARGNFRRQECSFPPIKMKFDKTSFTNSSLTEHNKLKLVTHCQPSKSTIDRIFEEYLMYRAYEYITPYSFKVRMLRINYVDTGSKKSPGQFYAFVIEDIDQLAQRNGGEEYSGRKLTHPEQADRVVSTLMPIFMYMQGNTDWSVAGGAEAHNTKLIQLPNPTSRPIPIPYDFDYCGLIDAPYAIPPVSLGITDVTQRLYRGFCRDDAEWNTARNVYIENRDNILDLWRNDEFMEDKTKKSDIKYLEEFFDIIADKGEFDKTIKAECRTTR